MARTLRLGREVLAELTAADLRAVAAAAEAPDARAGLAAHLPGTNDGLHTGTCLLARCSCYCY